MIHKFALATCLFAANLSMPAFAAEGPPSPLNPEQALASFRLEPGLRVELVAAEPLVVDPVAIAFDASGKMFVAENRGYPTGPGEGKSPEGRIALLEDKDQDGLFESRTDFATGLTFPNGIMPWKDGILITCAPDILYLKDTDGDGRADVRRVVLTGFDPNNTTQLRVSHPTLALDNWIYLTSGLTGGKVRSPEHPERASVEIRTDSRFRPDTFEFEPLEGRAQFGLSFDDFGRRFICMNRVQVQHVVLPARYLRRNPDLAFSDTVQNCPEQMLAEPLKGHGASARIYPISENVTTADSHAGTFTAACGVRIYRSDGLPEEYRGGAFSCDPTGNLVHFDRLAQSGATFVARRVREGVEFLASTDNWFRPVNLVDGPDGALYICDMYRKTIEHPQYLPEEIRRRTDFDSGKGMGRIYRVIAADRAARPRPAFGLASATIEQLCATLHSANSWRADTAHRLLLEGKPKESIGLLRAALRDSDRTTAPGRVRALWVLQALDGLDDQTLRVALRAAAAGVRENAVRLAEGRIQQADRPSEWLELLAPLATDPDPRVRFQCALALGEISQDAVVPLLKEIALRSGADRWTRAAVLSSLRERAHALALALLQNPASASETMAAFLEDLGRLCGAGPKEAQPQTVQAMLAAPQMNLALLLGFAEGRRNSGRSSERNVFVSVFEGTPAVAEMAEKRFQEACRSAALIAADPRQSLASRLVAAKLLGHAPESIGAEALASLIDPHQPADLQIAAARSLVQRADAAGAGVLLERRRWQNYTPALREALLAALLASAKHLPALLDAFEAGTLPLGALDSGRRNQLLKHKDEQIRRRAEGLFQKVQSGDRMKIYEEHKAILKWPAHPATGRAVFKQHCASCHRLDREGVAVGPDLFGIRNQPKEAILLHVLVPDYEIVPGFTGYEIETKDGRTLSGLIASETESSLTVRGALGQEETVLRSNVTAVSATALSLMPQELEKNLSRQELADLIAYLKGE